MSKKKSKKKRNRRPRKGVMPPALRKYWAKKRAAKAKNRRRKKKNPGYHRASSVMRRFRRKTLRSRSGRKVRSKRMAKAILLSKLRAEGYQIAPKKNKRRHRRNPPRPKARSLRIPGTVTPKQRRAIGRFLARATGRRIVYKRA